MTQAKQKLTFFGMAFVVPLYDNYTVDLAGDALIGYNDAIEVLKEKDLEIGDIVTNWRSSHHYPLNTFQMTLRRRAVEVDENSIVAQRIKRMSSIEGKLKRYADSGLKLSAMQDIAGCRVILESVDSVMSLVNRYRGQYSSHALDSYNDYIGAPKRSGYRGYHLIFKYRGGKYENYQDPAAAASNGGRELNLYGYTSNELEDASKRLREVERFKERGSDAVLVSVSDAANLQRAFPNYYLDTEAFLQAYDEAVS